MLRTIKVALFVSILIVFLLGFFVHPEHEAHHFWQKIPFFEGIYGFIGCIVLIIFSKGLGHLFLEREEDYYD
ncbi:MAG TPA: hypothetical protein ENF30_01385 [Candidatus Desulfofervidus auxilii]|uniref:Uncharacterized protein n=1 Tax=Desulfofervidus auxilii TaxID=1621989 RepID=A0A7V0IA05_DESA2|nr:hypothetical protein [Candidatus Desulfofervidus auxilii]